MEKVHGRDWSLVVGLPVPVCWVLHQVLVHPLDGILGVHQEGLEDADLLVGCVASLAQLMREILVA